MSAKIIDSHRYKTITKTQVDKKRRSVENSFKSNKKSYKSQINILLMIVIILLSVI